MISRIRQHSDSFRLLLQWTLGYLVIAFSPGVARAQYYLDPLVQPAQSTAPWPGNSGVSLQGIQPFDPYATSPTLPPPVNSSVYPAPTAGAYGAPPPGYLGPAPSPPPPALATAPIGGPYQPSFNFNGGGLYGGFEAAILEPRYGNFAISSNEFGRPLTLNTSPDHGLKFSPRIIVGYEGPQGLGVRIKWWRFSDSSGGLGTITLSNPDEVFDSIPTTSEIEAQTFDLELTQDGRFHNWEFLVSGGVRWAQLDSLSTANWTIPNDDVFFQASTAFDGVGPVLGLSTKRSMRQWEGLTFVVNSRFSFLFGDAGILHTSDVSGVEEGPFSVLVAQDVMPVWDLQIGAQWTRRLYSGASIYFGGFFEAQLWDWIGPSTFDSDLGFWGPTFVIGISQ